MILVMLGTQDKQFKRLLDAVQKQINKKKIKEEVIVQAGYTKYESKDMQIFNYLPNDELKKLIIKADLIITHAGVGSIFDGIVNNKKIIAAARLKEYKEHVNDHQLEIIREFKNKGYILELNNFNNLDKVIAESKKFKPKPFKSNNKNFIKILEDYLSNE